MARTEYGGILIDGKQTGSTLQCCHCGAHWEHKPGSGVLRAWCRKCSAPTCGRWECTAECVPTEARLDYAEGTKTRYDDTIRDLISKGATLLVLLIALVYSSFAQNPKTAVYPGATAADKDLGVQTNHAQTTLAASMGSSDTSVAVNSCTGFLNQSYVGIGTEIAMLCACSAGTMQFGKSSCPNVDGRGMDGSAAAAHNNADPVLAYIMAGNHNQLAAEIKALEASLSSPTALRVKTCIVTFGDPGAASPVLASDNDLPRTCDNMLGVDWTIKSIACFENTGSSSVNPILTGGSATSLITAPLTCGTAGNVAGTVNGSPVVHTLSANGATCAVTPCTIDANINTADGVTKYIKLLISGTY